MAVAEYDAAVGEFGGQFVAEGVGAAFAVWGFSACAGFATRFIRCGEDDGAEFCDVGREGEPVVRGRADVCRASGCSAVRSAISGSQSVRLDHGARSAAGWGLRKNEMERGRVGVAAKRPLQIFVAVLGSAPGRRRRGASDF